MKHFDLKICIFTLAAAAGLGSFSSAATTFSTENHFFKRNNPREAKEVRQFRGQLPWLATSEPTTALGTTTKRHAASDSPSAEFKNLENYDFLEGPDGSTWFYTAEYDEEYIYVNDWYSERVIKGYKFTIYDSSFNKVGTIQDQVTLGEGETRVAHAVLDPSVSRKFFNSDANPEVMVYLAINTSEALGYQVNYYNKVYSVGGEKDAEGNDKCIGVMPGRCVDTFNAGTGDNENFFFTFAEDIYADPSDFDFSDYLAYINAAKTTATTFKKSSNGMPEIAFEKDIFLTRYPGDTTEGMYLITKTYNGTPYFIYSFYEKPYFVDPTGFATDESATPNNNLLIEVFKFDGTLTPVSTTKIPVEIKEVPGQVSYSFYSIGSLTWKDDIDMMINGTPQAPAFLVSRDNTTAANLEDISSSFELYGNDGKKIRTVAENTDGLSVLNSEKGDQPHALFVNIDEDSQYQFSFVDLYSGNKLFTLNQSFGSDPLTAKCQRVSDGNGKYKYVFEMQYDGLDEEGNDVKRMAWFNQDGSLDRIDEINMGPDVMYAAVNMFAECLSPYLYDNDAAMEYAILVKRAQPDGTTKNEFIIVDDNNKFYAHFTEDEGKGMPMMFSIIPGTDKNRLQMVYNDDYRYNVDIYDLPFTKWSGVETVPTDGVQSQKGSFDGTAINAYGNYITVFDTNGIKVAAGNDHVSLSGLSHGIYIAIIKDASGNASTMKVTY